MRNLRQSAVTCSLPAEEFHEFGKKKKKARKGHRKTWTQHTPSLKSGWAAVIWPRSPPLKQQVHLSAVLTITVNLRLQSKKQLPTREPNQPATGSAAPAHRAPRAPSTNLECPLPQAPVMSPQSKDFQVPPPPSYPRTSSSL